MFTLSICQITYLRVKTSALSEYTQIIFTIHTIVWILHLLQTETNLHWATKPCLQAPTFTLLSLYRLHQASPSFPFSKPCHAAATKRTINWCSSCGSCGASELSFVSSLGAVRTSTASAARTSEDGSSWVVQSLFYRSVSPRGRVLTAKFKSQLCHYVFCLSSTCPFSPWVVPLMRGSNPSKCAHYKAWQPSDIPLQIRL